MHTNPPPSPLFASVDLFQAQWHGLSKMLGSDAIYPVVQT